MLELVVICASQPQKGKVNLKESSQNAIRHDFAMLA